MWSSNSNSIFDLLPPKWIVRDVSALLLASLTFFSLEYSGRSLEYFGVTRYVLAESNRVYAVNSLEPTSRLDPSIALPQILHKLRPKESFSTHSKSCLEFNLNWCKQVCGSALVLSPKIVYSHNIKPKKLILTCR